MSNVSEALRGFADAIVGAVALAESGRQRMLSLAAELFAAGVRYVHFEKPTEAEPNADYDEEALTMLQGFACKGVDESDGGWYRDLKKPLKGAETRIEGSGVNAVTLYRWKCTDLCNVDTSSLAWRGVADANAKDALRDARAARDRWVKSLVSKLKIEECGPPERTPKSDDDDDEAAEPVLPEVWEESLQFFTHCQAKAVAMPVKVGGKPLSAKASAEVQDALASIIATIRRALK